LWLKPVETNSGVGHRQAPADDALAGVAKVFPSFEFGSQLRRSREASVEALAQGRFIRSNKPDTDSESKSPSHSLVATKEWNAGSNLPAPTKKEWAG
jgi:hypothetical protein